MAKVLVVDDDPVIVELLRVSFGIEGYTVVTASDGEEGLRRAASERPDVIVSDVMMPRVDGLELVTRLRADEATRHLPILLLSARAQNAEVQQGLEAGADAYVTKPFDPLDLVARVESLLQRSEG